MTIKDPMARTDQSTSHAGADPNATRDRAGGIGSQCWLDLRLGL